MTAKRMHSLGIHTGSDLRACEADMLTRIFGKAGMVYYNFARGIDERPVEAVRIRKSIGCEHTLEEDIDEPERADRELQEAAIDLTERLNRKEFKGNTLTLKIKFHDFTQITRSLTVADALTDYDDILATARRLMAEVDFATRPVRLIGLSVSNPREAASTTGEPTTTEEVWRQLSFDFGEYDDSDGYTAL